MTDEQQLIQRMLAGDEQAFEAFFNAYFARVYRFALPRLNGDTDATREVVQAALAKAIMSPSFQIAFNKVKGSVPARTDVATTELDACGQKGAADLKAAAESGNLFGSNAHGYANPASVKNAMYDVITAHFNGEYDSETAVEEMVGAVEMSQ